MRKTINIPDAPKQLMQVLLDAGYEAYVVGGCVRDFLLGHEPHDWDICTNALPDQMKECFANYHVIETGLQHGTLTVMVDHVGYEITTYRIDGKAFHTFTKGFDKPFDSLLMDAMNRTMKYLCENIQGCVLGYTQSDEISLLLVDYQTLTTDSWFDDTVQKMCSISASMATLAFNKAWKEVVDEWGEKTFGSSWFEGGTNEPIDELLKKKADTYCSKYDRALFDSRVFNVPKEDVTNYFVWRQQDATRNSIQSAGQACFSHRELMNKTCNMIQDMLFTEKGINWNDYSTSCKRGTCCVKRMVDVPTGNVCGAVQEVVRRQKWQLDTGIPIFTQEPNYINGLVFVGD